MFQRSIPLFIVLFTALLLIVAFFIPHKPFGDLESRFLNWYAIISGFTFLLGLDSLTRHHLLKVIRREKGWFYSLLLVLSLFATLTVGLYSWVKFSSPFALRAPFMWLYKYMIIPLQATMFATLAFFIFSAAYRAFRIRNLGATLLLIAACLVMLGNVPLGSSIWQRISQLVHLVFPNTRLDLLYQIELFAQVKDWLMAIPQAAAGRGIGIGLALGGIAMSLRIILGIERTYLSS
ncbi:MAG: hypothetical protein K6T77_06185 [candidate division WOR-3 bacterium]|nr:hypothetical protein [candidate division WOR-3 bacterium]